MQCLGCRGPRWVWCHQRRHLDPEQIERTAAKHRRGHPGERLREQETVESPFAQTCAPLVPSRHARGKRKQPHPQESPRQTTHHQEPNGDTQRAVRRQSAAPNLGVADLSVQNSQGDLRKYHRRRDPMQRDGEWLVLPPRWLACHGWRILCIHRVYSRVAQAIHLTRKRVSSGERLRCSAIYSRRCLKSQKQGVPRDGVR